MKILGLKADEDLTTVAGRNKYTRRIRREKLKSERKINKSVRRIFRTQKKRVLQSVGLSRDLIEMKPALDKAVDSTQDDMIKSFRRVLMPLMRARGKEVIKDLLKAKDAESVFDSFLFDWIQNYVAGKVVLINNNTKRKLRSIIELGVAIGENGEEIAKRITASAPGVFPASRARTISRTEVHTSFEAANRQAARATKILGLKKQWLPALDLRVRDWHKISNWQHPHIIPMEESFLVPNVKGTSFDLMSGPGDYSAPAGQVINCRCTLIHIV